MGLVMISEGMLDEKVYTGTYSIPANSSLSMGSTILQKREKNLEGGPCATVCDSGSVPIPNNDECAILYGSLYDQASQFKVDPCTSRFRSWFIRGIMSPD